MRSSILCRKTAAGVCDLSNGDVILRVYEGQPSVVVCGTSGQL